MTKLNRLNQLILLCLSVWIFAGSLQANAQASCKYLFASKADTIESWLLQSGLTPSSSKKPSLFLRMREKSLLKRLDPAQLTQDSYREWWVDQIVDLKISQKLDPLSDYELSVKKSDRQALKRLILRSAIENGLQSYLQDTSGLNDSSIKLRLISIARDIRFHPLFKLILDYEVEYDKIILTERQLNLLLTDGVSALKADRELREAIGQNRRDQRFVGLAHAGAKIILMAIALNGYMERAPTLQQQAIQFQIDMQAGANHQFMANAHHASNLDTNAMLLGLAKSEQQILVKDYREKYKTAPTVEETKQFKSYVCERSMSFTGEQLASCLAL